ncbi:hypothetical protein Taro_012512 [Colocasia esculenta]|uniref:Uncharacterized protein n=1 Tax=Colocasia esculenta TaxID=4460 RepID=A0A843U451_COLES|nr:hypothetical protein [Colocasia esculenta]
MRGTMNVITRLARTMNERLDAMAEVERYRMKIGIYRGYDMRCAAQRLTPGPQLVGRPFAEVVPEIDVDELLNEEHPLHAWVETRAEREIPELHLDDRLDNKEKVQANKQQHLETSKEDSKTLPILCLALDVPSMENMSMGHMFSLMR